MDSEARKPLSLKIKLPDLESLRVLSNNMTTLTRNSFVSKYGGILDLLFIDVQTGVILTLTQFYDPPLRSFLFKDFQLAPTIEEFERIVGVPQKGKGPYVEIGCLPPIGELAKALDIKASELKANEKERRGFKGFPASYLEQKAVECAKAPNREPFINILALLIYGSVLFPSLEGFVDSAAISVFWAVCKGDKDPVPALLADTYFELHERHEKGKGSISLCFPLLYRWFTSHLPGDQLQWDQLSVNGNWPYFLASLPGNSLRWHALEVNKDIIIRCGDFPNVPLIGSRACINYNPVLAMRQLGRYMLDKPEDSSLESMLLPGTGASDPALLRRIVRAWEKVETVNKLKRKEGLGNETYSQWVAERVLKVKLPFIPKVPVAPPAPEPAPVSLEEVARLHRIIAELEQRKGELTDGLLKAVQGKSKLEQEAKEKDIAIEDLQDQLATMENGKIKVDEALFGAGCELSHRNERIKSLERELKRLRGSSTEVARLEAKIEEDRQYVKRTFRTQKEGFLKKTKELERILAEEKEKLHDMAEHYESKLSKQGEEFEALFQLKEEHWKRELAKSNFALDEEKLKVEDLRRDLNHVYTQAGMLYRDRLEWIDRFRDLKEETQMLVQDRDAWRSKFHALASLTNASIELFWDRLKRANALVSLTHMHREVKEFVEFCAQRVKEFKERIRSEM